MKVETATSEEGAYLCVKQLPFSGLQQLLTSGDEIIPLLARK